MVSDRMNPLPSPLLVMNLLSLSAGPSHPLGKLITNVGHAGAGHTALTLSPLMRQRGRCRGYLEVIGAPPTRVGKLHQGEVTVSSSREPVWGYL